MAEFKIKSETPMPDSNMHIILSAADALLILAGGVIRATDGHTNVLIEGQDEPVGSFVLSGQN